MAAVKLVAYIAALPRTVSSNAFFCARVALTLADFVPAFVQRKLSSPAAQKTGSNAAFPLSEAEVKRISLSALIAVLSKKQTEFAPILAALSSELKLLGERTGVEKAVQLSAFFDHILF